MLLAGLKNEEANDEHSVCGAEGNCWLGLLWGFPDADMVEVDTDEDEENEDKGLAIVDLFARITTPDEFGTGFTFTCFVGVLVLLQLLKVGSSCVLRLVLVIFGFWNDSWVSKEFLSFYLD